MQEVKRTNRTGKERLKKVGKWREWWRENCCT